MTELGPDVERVWKLIDDIGVCMLASHDGDMIRARPLAARPHRESSLVYFLTSARGHKDDEIEADNSVCLCFAKPGSIQYLVVTGRARILNDRPLITRLWDNRIDSPWWTNADDPDIRAIEVTPIDAQFWEGPHGVIGTAASVLTAMAGQMPIAGDQRKVQLS